VLNLVSFLLPSDISWSTPIGVRYSHSLFSTPSLRWEVVMTLLTFGIAMRNSAHQILSEALRSASGEIFESKSKEAASLLTRSAGLFEYIG
jgi:hypothetical protein